MTSTADLPPGRQLDALIAEKVMGLRVYHTDHFHYRGELDYFLDEVGSEYVPAYSADIAAAWEVADAVRGKLGGLFNVVWNDTRPEYPRYWSASFCRPHAATGIPRLFSENSEVSAPHAICLAGLKAVSSADEQDTQRG